jgi:mRNA-degrading endonuclease toxin of MazEF toxin-antitoxin module
VKPFDIYSWRPPGWPEPHPAVIISNPDRIARKPEVEVLMCSSRPAGRAALPGEIILDAADLIHAVKKADLTLPRGRVSPERRAQLVRVIIAAHAWGDVLAG